MEYIDVQLTDSLPRYKRSLIGLAVLLNFTFWIKLKSVELMVELNMQYFVVIYAVMTDNKPFSELGGMMLKITDNDEKKVSQLSSTGHN